MLSRDQQQLLAAVGTGMAANALLDDLRSRDTLEGGCSAPQDGCWINYNRKALWLEDHSEFSAALNAAGPQGTAGEQAPWRKVKSTVLVKVTWAEAAAHGAGLSPALRHELATLQRTERVENRSWSEFSDQRGGWPHRRRFATDAEHQVAQSEWDGAYRKHLGALRDVWDRRKSAVERALPLTVDDDPVDLLELLDQQPTPTRPAASPSAAALQAGALQAAPAADSRATSSPEEGLFTLPTPDDGIGRGASNGPKLSVLGTTLPLCGSRRTRSTGSGRTS
jgi:hypothetical protein